MLAAIETFLLLAGPNQVVMLICVFYLIFKFPASWQHHPSLPLSQWLLSPHRPITDNICCCFSCLFVQFNNSYKIKVNNLSLSVYIYTSYIICIHDSSCISSNIKESSPGLLFEIWFFNLTVVTSENWQMSRFMQYLVHECVDWMIMIVMVFESTVRWFAAMRSQVGYLSQHFLFCDLHKGNRESADLAQIPALGWNLSDLVL